MVLPHRHPIVLFGFVLSILGVVGEYIGRIYDETKNCPIYILSETYGRGQENDVVAKNE